MPVLFVARSVKLSRWASDVGQGKHVYKVGVADSDPKALVAAGWAGETDWKLVKSRDVEGFGEEEAIERLAKKERMLDPNLYPKLKGTAGVTDLRYLANLVAMGHLDASVDRVVDFDDLGEVRGLVADLLGRRVKGKAVLRMSQPG